MRDHHISADMASKTNLSSGREGLAQQLDTDVLTQQKVHATEVTDVQLTAILASAHGQIHRDLRGEQVLQQLRLADRLARGVHQAGQSDDWAAAGFTDTLSRWKMKLEVIYGN